MKRAKITATQAHEISLEIEALLHVARAAVREVEEQGEVSNHARNTLASIATTIGIANDKMNDVAEVLEDVMREELRPAFEAGAEGEALQ